jgi:hypothetical protein
MAPYARVRGVDDDGVDLVVLGDRPVDVLIDDRRVWTFWVVRDTEAVAAPSARGPWPVRRAPWPRSLRRHLNGRSRFTIRDSATGKVLFDRQLSLGEGSAPIRVRNERGVDLGIDKSGRLVPVFAGRSEADIAALLDATETVLDGLRSAGLEPFLAYGTLLGAVREGAVLGHDSDADLGYVSRHTDPVDVVRESFAVQRRLAREGWRIERYSGASFKIIVTEGDVSRGLDVFGGFFSGGRLYLTGEVGTAFEHEWIHPLGSATLEGRPMPVPAKPEKLLEAMYGPGWRVPDPAFQFTTPHRTVRAFDDWFRGTQTNARLWARRARGKEATKLRRHSPLAGLALDEAERLGAEVLDVGAGRGADSLWLARHGVPVVAYDFVPRALRDAHALAAAESLDLEVRHLNLGEWRSVLAEGARLAHHPRPRVVLARHVVDATTAFGRESLARLCSMALREGGSLFAEFHVPTDHRRRPWMVGRTDVDAMTTLLRRAGAARVEVEHLKKRLPTVRVVGEW